MAAALLVPAALAQPPATDTDPSTPRSCDSRTATHHVKSARATIRSAFARSKWRQRRPARPEQLFDIAQHRECLTRGKDRKALTRYKREAKMRIVLYRRYREAAPFPGYRGRGIWLTHLAVPRYIVDCESRGRWWAYNPSGASWLYQLLGWGAPAPLTAEDKVRNHEIAHAVSSGSRNFSPWVCA